ncbi:VENN motif pre-toxin domain-containing protein, partial [Moraxella catarrhalis]|uniref:VENN motif pre-toxin domain-containing protein n=1 Tax=Moraxella catarrhalis TaxID=480 RepID=UPI001D0D88F5
MWGDYQVDDPNTLTQAQKDKLINQAKLIAGITAVFAGEDVNVAAGVAAEAVENNAVNKSQSGNIIAFIEFFNNTNTKMGQLVGSEA